MLKIQTVIPVLLSSLSSSGNYHANVMADWARAVAKKNNLLPLANDFSAIRANFTV